VGVERTGWGGGAQGFISGGMLPVSKDTHFTQKNKWVPHTHHFLTTSWVIFRDFFPISQALLSSFTSHSFYSPPLPSPSYFSAFFHPPSRSMFSSTPRLSSPPFRLCCTANTPNHPNFIPPFSHPFFRTRHAHLCVSCMFSDSQTIIFFFTDQAIQETHRVAEENGCDFSKWDCFSL